MRYAQSHTKNSIHARRGFTLLFAVIVSVLVLSVGASMINIAVKQVILSGSGRESQYAFYAANTGIECALYWDINGVEIDEGEIKYVFPPPGGVRISDTDLVSCGGTNLATGLPNGGVDYLRAWETVGDATTFYIAISNDISDTTSGIQYCAAVTVRKEVVDEDVITTITSQGLNTCDPEGTLRAVQRGLVLQYES
jgi:hypothetical protein